MRKQRMKFLCCVLAVAFIGVFAVGAEAFLGLFGSTPPPMSDEDFIRLSGNGSAEEVRAAIQSGANVNARETTIFGALTPLTEAAGRNNDPEVITALIEGGADTETTVVRATSRNNTALHIAIRRSNNPEIAAALIEGGANIEALREESSSLGGNGQTPLMDAARSSNFDAVTLLLAAGANVNAVSSEGDTALMLAADSPLDRNPGTPEIIIALINGGADVNMTRLSRGFGTAPRTITALNLARGNRRLRDTEALRMLEELTQN